MLQYLEMSAVVPAGFSQLWSMGISIPLPRRLVLRALEAGECLSAFKKSVQRSSVLPCTLNRNNVMFRSKGI